MSINGSGLGTEHRVTIEGVGPTPAAALSDAIRRGMEALGERTDPITEDSLGCCDESISPMDADGVPTVQ